MDEYKHYIRIDEDNIVIHGFSNAFEQPQVDDICIDEDAPRHFQVELRNENMQFIHKVVNGEMVLRTEEDMFDLEKYKQAKTDLLSGLRNVELEGGFTSGVLRNEIPLIFSYDIISQQRFTKQGTLLNIDPTINVINWGTKNASFVTMNRSEFIQILKEAANHELTIEFKFLYAEANILNVDTKEEVDGIEW